MEEYNQYVVYLIFGVLFGVIGMSFYLLYQSSWSLFLMFSSGYILNKAIMLLEKESSVNNTYTNKEIKK